MCLFERFLVSIARWNNEGLESGSFPTWVIEEKESTQKLIFIKRKKKDRIPELD